MTLFFTKDFCFSNPRKLHLVLKLTRYLQTHISSVAILQTPCHSVPNCLVCTGIHTPVSFLCTLPHTIFPPVHVTVQVTVSSLRVTHSSQGFLLFSKPTRVKTSYCEILSCFIGLYKTCKSLPCLQLPTNSFTLPF